MENDRLISVIVPVYNTDKTLERCFDSILRQTYDQFLILLVDDGSSDKSAVLCDNLAEKSDNVIVVHKENEGLGPTRNVGLLLSEGKYIYQMDSDDWIDEILLESVYRSAEENAAELVLFGYRLFSKSDGHAAEYGLIRADGCIITGEQNVRAYFCKQLGNSFFVMSACNKFFRRDFLHNNHITFKPMRRSQDVVFALDVFDRLSRLSVLDQPFYHYLIIPGVFKKNASIENFVEVYEEMSKYVQSWGMYCGEIKRKIDYLYLSQIFNLAAFQWLNMTDSAERRMYIDHFLSNERVRRISAQLRTEEIPSRYIRGIKKYYDAGKSGGMTGYFRLHSLLEKLLRQ